MWRMDSLVVLDNNSLGEQVEMLCREYSFVERIKVRRDEKIVKDKNNLKPTMANVYIS